MLEIAVMDHSGDSKQIWDIDNPDEVEAARKMFDELKAKGYTGFHVKEDGAAGKRMDTFEPKAGRLIMVPALKGG
jgi:GrpB-like predicted nucleotidyltransferase (UPF0157 family)